MENELRRFFCPNSTEPKTFGAIDDGTFVDPWGNPYKGKIDAVETPQSVDVYKLDLARVEDSVVPLEAAVLRALRWLKLRQREDGSWTAEGEGDATAFALLPR